MLLLSPYPALDSLSSHLDQKLLSPASGVDLVFVSGSFSYSEYLRPKGIKALKPTFPTYSFRPQLTTFGACRQTAQGFIRPKGMMCGYLATLGEGDEGMSVLGYDELALSGRFQGSWEVALSDGSVGAPGVVIGRIHSPEGGRFSLRPLIAGADASRVRTLILKLVSPTGSAAVDDASFTHTAKHPEATGRGVWIWDRKKVLGREDAALELLATHAAGRVYLQVADDPAVFHDFLEKAARRGVKVYALDGSPSYLAFPDPLLGRIRAVEAYNASHPEAAFAGFQIDVEPYLNKDFNLRRGYYAQAYVDLLTRIKKVSSLPLSVAVPFWFDTIPQEGRPLIQRIVEGADEVVVMSYRTDPALLLDIARPTLALGELLGKPVWLGIELGAVPDEHHIEYLKCRKEEPGAVRLGEYWLKRGAEYDVPGSRISFHGRSVEVASFMKTEIPYASFKGWVLHSFEELSK